VNADIKKKESNPLSELCKEISLKRFKNHSVSEDLKIGNIREKDDGTEISQWLSLIFIKSSGLKISFKSKYHVENIKHFAASALLDSVKNLTKNKIDDFTKEFCNLTAGGIKEHLEKIVGKSNISLPLLTRWDDNVFFLPNVLDDRNSFSFHDSWEIYLDSNKNRFIQCYLSVEVSDENEVKALMEEMHYTEEVAEDGEIDFL
tara:strand:- start:239 stop:847 length:609 start_codon:yes stop_codon:yes gene_type:complete